MILNDEATEAGEGSLGTGIRESRDRTLGAVPTPPEIAETLATWAIQHSSHTVLDIGVGTGVFVAAAYQRLISLGANVQTARGQVYGTEIDPLAYAAFNRGVATRCGPFPNIVQADFFAVDTPRVDAVIGNPPYVRRMHLGNFPQLREWAISEQSASSLSSLADLYIYFLMRASEALRPGGRLAVITADSWLNARYGTTFKEYLTAQFTLHAVVGLDTPVFPGAEVKPVVLLAERRSSSTSNVRFMRVRDLPALSTAMQSPLVPHSATDAITSRTVAQESLNPSRMWDVHFHSTDVYRTLATHPMMTSMATLARTRLGVQTLAKEFFILPAATAQSEGIEPEYLQPLAHSARWQTDPTIEPGDTPITQLFYCAADKESLRGTGALAYIERGEAMSVPVRGKERYVIGYQNKDRIARAGRTHWYDLRTAIERRGRAKILVPRLIYRTFEPKWNRGSYVPGELFIEVFPHESEADEIYLAAFSSSMMEFLFRSHAQLYGGGAFNLNAGQFPHVPTLNIPSLSPLQRAELIEAYRIYVRTKGAGRAAIDAAVSQIIDLPTAAIEESLSELLERAHPKAQ